MDINEQLNSIVLSLVDDLKISLEQQVHQQVTDQIVTRIASTEISDIIQQVTAKQLESKLANYNFEATSKQKLDQIVTNLIDSVNKNLVHNANQQISAEINKQLSSIDIRTIVSGIVEQKLVSLVTSGAFPQGSIPHTSINFSGVRISGDQVQGGIIENFGSTGIEDRATHVQMTLMDHATVFEGPVWAPEGNIKGSLTVEGDLIINGDIPSDCLVIDKLVSLTQTKVKEDQEMLNFYQNAILDKIATNGLDLSKITMEGREAITGTQLGYHIVDSNLRRVGILNDLQTSGENLLSDTLYVTSRRVGINTTEPSAALAVWDEETEVIVSKRKQDTGYLGTTRNQRLMLGANNKENLILETDSSVTIKNLRVGETSMSSSKGIPNYAGTPGQIVWNESPTLGGPIGWVCLGDALWSKFGKIE